MTNHKIIIKQIATGTKYKNFVWWHSYKKWEDRPEYVHNDLQQAFTEAQARANATSYMKGICKHNKPCKCCSFCKKPVGVEWPVEVQEYKPKNRKVLEWV